MNAPIVIVQKIRSVIPSFKEHFERKAVVRKPKVSPLQLQLDSIPPDILEEIARELRK